MTTVADLRALFPEVADALAYTDEYLGLKLNSALKFVSRAILGSDYDEAQAYAAMHIIEMTGGGSRGIGVQSVSAGSASVTYAAFDGSSTNWWAGTAYGQHFLAIARLHTGTQVVHLDPYFNPDFINAVIF